MSEPAPETAPEPAPQPTPKPKSKRSSKHNAKSLPTKEHRPAKKQKTVDPKFNEKWPPLPPLRKIPEEAQQHAILDPYEHHRPPFEKFWDANAVPVPTVQALEEEQEKAADVMYFAYGKDMDPYYLGELFHSSGATGTVEFVGVGKLSEYRWVVEPLNRFPMTVKLDEEGEVWGLVYKLSEPLMEILNSKATKRGIKMEEQEIETFEKTGLPGFWDPPLLPFGKLKVQVMVGATNNAEKAGQLQGSKKRKVLAGLLWGASEGLPEHYKAEIRAKAGGIKDPRDTQYWTMCREKPNHPKGWRNGSGDVEKVAGRRSSRLKSLDTTKTEEKK